MKLIPNPAGRHFRLKHIPKSIEKIVTHRASKWTKSKLQVKLWNQRTELLLDNESERLLEVPVGSWRLAKPPRDASSALLLLAETSSNSCWGTASSSSSLIGFYTNKLVVEFWKGKKITSNVTNDQSRQRTYFSFNGGSFSFFIFDILYIWNVSIERFQ